ncbi:MAG: ParB-like nuclease domain-containing protein, partial [Desulfatitalea sp.]|nr:ParB-like nuclease domain-containing protein [Desulfatitalea sp.]
MVYEIRTVPLSQFDMADTTFRISTRESDDTLVGSIRGVGLIQPPIVLEKGGTLIVVSGFAREAACRAMGWPEIPARCLPADTPFIDCALLAVADNTAQRTLNVVETARAMALLGRAAATQDGAYSLDALLQIVGLGANPQLTEKLQPVPFMPEWLQRGLAEGAIPLPMALRLHALADAAAAEALVALFRELEWSLNRQREFLDWVLAIAHREALPLVEVLADPQVTHWRQDAQMDKGHKSQQIRQHIRKRRYPAITAFETRYTQTLKAL